MNGFRDGHDHEGHASRGGPVAGMETDMKMQNALFAAGVLCLIPGVAVLTTHDGSTLILAGAVFISAAAIVAQLARLSSRR